jgi:hypothetical protein
MHSQIWVLALIQSQLPALRVKSSTYTAPLIPRKDRLFKPDCNLAAVAEMAPLFPTCHLGYATTTIGVDLALPLSPTWERPRPSSACARSGRAGAVSLPQWPRRGSPSHPDAGDSSSAAAGSGPAAPVSSSGVTTRPSRSAPRRRRRSSVTTRVSSSRASARYSAS